MADTTVAPFYDGSKTILARLQQWMAECNQLGVSFRQAAIVGAVAWNESACMMRVPRSQMLVYPNDCLPARPCLIVENGTPALGTKLLSSWTQDSKLMDALSSRGWLTADKTQLTAAVTGTDGVHPNDVIAWIFEYLIDQRKTAAMAAYSIGPTQAYMKFSPLTGGASNIASRLPTIDDLWEFYTAVDAQAMFQTGIFDYLPTTISGYPTPNSQAGQGSAGVGNPINVETYLQSFQTGSRNWDDPAWSGYAKQFLAAVKAAWSAAQSLGGWTNDPQGDMGPSA